MTLPTSSTCVGENVLLIGTNFGHTDASSEYDALMKLRASTEITESTKHSMLSVTRKRFYGLTGRVKPAPTVEVLADVSS